MQKLTPKEAGKRSNERFTKQNQKKREDKKLAKIAKLNELRARMGRQPYQECNAYSSKTKPVTEKPKMVLTPHTTSNKVSMVKSTASACSES